jgi:rhamnosyltransferase subunit B
MSQVIRHFILCPFGSGGDVFPFIGIGRALLSRGHRVTLVGVDMFQAAVEEAGLHFIPFAVEAEFDDLAGNPDLWKPLQGSRLVFRAFANAVPRSISAIREALGDGSGSPVMVTSGAVFGARILREKLRLPQVVIHLQPAVFMSAYDTPVYLQGTAWLTAMTPTWIKKLAIAMPNILDLVTLPLLRPACLAEGIQPPKSVWKHWWHSPDGNVALFPSWFAAQQQDWPQPHYQHTFPLEDLGADQVLSSELESFLAAGPPPVVFTPGTGNQHGKAFFHTALEAVQSAGLRAIFATRYPEQCLPKALPPEVLAVKYAPFSRLLPKTMALVSHGGIGTCSQAMAAGIPHLIMALAHDQPDNANRLKRLGIGEGISPRRFTAKRVERWLRKIQADAELPQRLDRVKALIAARPDMAVLCDWLEQASLKA